MVRTVLAVVLAAATISGPSARDLGEITVAQPSPGVVRVDLSGKGCAAARTMRPVREVEYEVTGGGELISLQMRVRSGHLSIRRGANVVTGVTNLAQARSLTDGRAVASLREHIGEFERRLLTGASSSRDPHAHGFLLQGALIAQIGGDPVAVSRARDVVMRPQASLAAAGADRCAADYDRVLPDADRRRTACLMRADADDSWHARVGERLLCDAGFVSAVAAAEAAYATCGVGPWSGSFLSGWTTNWLVGRGGR